MFFLRATAAVALCWACLSCAPARLDPAVEQRIEKIQSALPPAFVIQGDPAAPTLAERMAALKVPGVSIAVIHQGKIEWARGFGVTRIGGPPITPDTIFQAGSISKPVAAMAMLRVVEAGRLNLDAPVNQYLKTWKVPESPLPTRQVPVTLRMLLTHSAGMSVHGFPGYAAGAAVPSMVQVLNGQPPANTDPVEVDTIPGTIWKYSGGGYTIAQVLIQDVTGTPFPKLLHDTVLAPIGMTHSTYEQPLPANRQSEAATPYDHDGQPVPGGAHTYPEMAAAGLWTTASDLALYAIEVQQSLAGKSNRVLSQAMTRQMLTPGLNKWGLGPQTGGGPDRPWFGHGGADEGFQSYFVAYHDGEGVAILTNSDNGSQLASEIVHSIAREYGWPDFQPIQRTLQSVERETLDRYTGAYQLTPDFLVTISREGDQLFAEAGGQKEPMLATGAREFVVKGPSVLMTFDSMDARGRPTKLITLQGGEEVSGPRIGAVR